VHEGRKNPVRVHEGRKNPVRVHKPLWKNIPFAFFSKQQKWIWHLLEVNSIIYKLNNSLWNIEVLLPYFAWPSPSIWASQKKKNTMKICYYMIKFKRFFVLWQPTSSLWCRWSYYSIWQGLDNIMRECYKLLWGTKQSLCHQLCHKYWSLASKWQHHSLLDTSTTSFE
jgi:hypothetical protein